MSALKNPRKFRPCLRSTLYDAFLSALSPECHCSQNTRIARFTTSPCLQKRDNNRTRGLSAVRSTGVRARQTLSVKNKDFAKQQLPTPVERTSIIQGDPDHGLWEFFKNKKLLATPVEEARHGRAWTVVELRNRNWEDLHQLWWVCVKERNRLATERIERRRLDAGLGDSETQKRDDAVQNTMKAIISTLVERNNAYYEAFELAQQDPTIDLTRAEHQYQEPTYEVDEMGDEALEDPARAVPPELQEPQKAASTDVDDARIPKSTRTIT